MVKWNEVKRGAKVTLSKKYVYRGLDKKKHILPKGSYFVNGFWADACGLSKTRSGLNDYVIPSNGLIYFDGITE